ncbi:MAG: serpin family protein [Simkaniaceae bacterium]|nr:serpin family protein [Candidatus Sacchlamyda saccharinae]
MKKYILILLLPFHLIANTVGEDSNAFSLALYSKLPKEGNLAFSPYGVFSHLALLHFGAQGQTAQQIQNALHLSATGDQFLKAFSKHYSGLTSKGDRGYHFYIANALFPHKGTEFVTRYKEIATQSFHALLKGVDFDLVDSTLETINDWALENSDGNIKEIIQSKDFDNSTRMITTNAAYFQGAWVHPFRVEKGIFQSKPVDMLHAVHSFPYFENSELQALSLPIVRDGHSQPFLEFLIVLPKTTLSTKEIDKILYNLKPTGLSVHIPKFCFSQTLLLNGPLKQLGIKDAFTYQANFSKMDKMRDLSINSMLHETYFAFHEEGISSSSACLNNLAISPSPPIVDDGKEFVANRPFLFFLVDYHSRAILFMGRVEDPTSENCDEN